MSRLRCVVCVFFCFLLPPRPLGRATNHGDGSKAYLRAPSTTIAMLTTCKAAPSRESG